jgi:hypothetical protein
MGYVFNVFKKINKIQIIFIFFVFNTIAVFNNIYL